MAKKKTTKKTASKGYGLARRTNAAVNKVSKQYANYAKTYQNNVNAQRDADIAASDADYAQNANNAALRNAVQQRELQRQMYRNGITGGASETSMMNQANNYATQQGVIANNKAASAAKIRQQANADVAAYKLQNAQARDTAIQSARDREYNKYQNWLNREDTKANTKYQHKIDKYNRYADTVAGYDSIKAVNKAIRQAKKSKKNRWKVAYLRKQRAAIRERNYNRTH